MATDYSVESAAAAYDWDEFRGQMPVARKWAYFDHAAVGPIPAVTHDEIAKWADEAAGDGDVMWPSWKRQNEDLRELTAKVINSRPEEIALIPNTTVGINLVSEGFPWMRGDNIVLPEHEFPSNLYPWKSLEARGVEVRQVPLVGNAVCPNRIADACDQRTRIVSASWVGYASGYRIDPAEIASVAHDNDALFFLDAIQGLGVFPIDVQATGVDFLAADGHKWLLGPEGAGVFFTRREHLDLLRPLNVGWNSVKQGCDFSNVALDVRDSASRYEGGTQNTAGLIGLGASLKLLVEFGLTATKSPIADRVLHITDLMCQSLEAAGARIFSPRDDAVRSGIVSFEMPGQPSEPMRDKLLDAAVVTSYRGHRVRAAAHCYNNGDDIQRMVEAIRKLS